MGRSSQQASSEDDDMSLRLVNDFKHCESVGDYQTIKNRIAGGLKWGWLKALP